MLSFPFLPAYVRFVVLANSERGFLWDEARWRDFTFPALDPLVRSLGSDASIYVRALASGSRSNNVTVHDWSEDVPSRWVEHLQKARIVDLQLFVPARTEKSKNPPYPKLYLQMQPMTWEGSESKMAYDHILHIAVKQSDFDSRRETIESCLTVLQRSAGIVGAYSCRSRVSTVNAFESLVREDFMYRGMLNDQLPDLARTRTRWSEWR